MLAVLSLLLFCHLPPSQEWMGRVTLNQGDSMRRVWWGVGWYDVWGLMRLACKYLWIIQLGERPDNHSRSRPWRIFNTRQGVWVWVTWDNWSMCTFRRASWQSRETLGRRGSLQKLLQNSRQELRPELRPLLWLPWCGEVCGFLVVETLVWVAVYTV